MTDSEKNLSSMDDKIMVTSGIFRTERNGELFCLLCTSNDNLTNWESHTKNSSHICALRQFHLIFVENCEKISCKACNATIDWSGVKDHANWHRIVPWYEIQDKYKTFFENRVSQIDSSFDCFLCETKFTEWTQAFVHIGEDEHVNAIANVPPIHESFVPTGTTYEILVNEGFEPWGSTTVKCRLCNRPNVSLKTIAQHVAETEHSQAKLKFRTNFQVRSDARPQQPSNNAKLINNDNKISRTLHNDRKQIYQPRSNSVNHERKDSTGHQHNNGNFRNSRGRNFNAISKRSNSLTSVNRAPRGSNDFPVQQRGDVRYCVVCDVNVDTSVDQHLKNDGHIYLLRKYGHEYIEPIDDRKFSCKCCKCVVPNLENVFRHIKGYNHNNLLKKFRKNEPVEEKNPTKNSTISFKMNFSQITGSKMPQKVGVKEFRNNGVEIPKKIGMNMSQNTKIGAPQQAGIDLFQQFPIGLLQPHPVRLEQSNPMLPLQIPQQIPIGFQQTQLIRQQAPIVYQPVPPMPQCNPTNLPKTPWETQPRDYIVVQSAQNLFCRICDCIIYGHENVDKHIRGSDHNNAVDRLRATVSYLRENVYHCEPCNTDINGRHYIYNHVLEAQHVANCAHPSFNSSPIKRDPIKSGFDRPINDFIVKLCNNDYVCKICHLLLYDDEKINEHLVSKEHTNAIGLCGTEDINDGKYYCKYCRCTIPNFANVSLHVSGFKHKANQPNTKHTASLKDAKNDDNSESLVRNFIAKIGDTDYYCKICNLSLSSLSNVDEHVTSTEHSEAIEKYDCRSLIMTNKTWDCQLCHCVIPSFDNIFVHLSGQKHLQNVKENRGKTIGKETGLSGERQNEHADKISENQLDKQQESAVKSVVKEDYDHIINMLITETKKLENTNNETSDAKQIDGNLKESSSNKLDDVRATSSKCSEDDSSAVGKDFVKLRSLASSLRLNEIGNTERKRRAPKAITSSNNDKDVNIVDDIYNMTEKLRYVEKSTKFCFSKDDSSIYCLICRKTITNDWNDYYQHFGTIEHCKFLESIEKDHELFESVQGQFSEIDLASQYMEEISNDQIYCHVCDVGIENIDSKVNDHIIGESHELKHSKMTSDVMKHYNDARSMIHCDWYSILKYLCVPCSTNYENEISFVKHFETQAHNDVMNNPQNTGKVMFYDCCIPCAIMWYGYRSSYADHSELRNHKWQIMGDSNLSSKLPMLTKCLLENPKKHINDTIDYLNGISIVEENKIERLIRDLENIAKFKFPEVKAYAFGWKCTGLDSTNNCVEIFLDCKLPQDLNGPVAASVECAKRIITECLVQDPLWNIEEILPKNSELRIKAQHREVGICCNIFFDNAIAVESTKLIKFINNKFSSCRKMTIFLQQWLEFCGLLGPEIITNDALGWFVIFYLQNESLLPKIITLIEEKDKLGPNTDWQLEAYTDLISDENSGRNTMELLVGFFKFYANFDYRNYVACPLNGTAVKKQDFADPQKFPENIARYIEKMKISQKFETFDITPMCIQNPLYLGENFTKNVSKVLLCHFRSHCLKSLDILENPSKYFEN